MKKNALILVLSLIFLEWLDFSLYLYLAKLVFAKQFFPNASNSLMLSFALFAAAYFARPIGGWLFGQRADQNGRRKPMIFSAALMGVATLGICALPTFDQIGLWSTGLLLLFRLAQGLALGGEINTSALFLIEHHQKKTLIVGGLIAASSALGMFFGGAIASFISYFDLTNFWRFVFGTVGFLSLWVCRLRKQLTESPEFLAQTQHPQTEYWRDYRAGIINIMLLGAYVSTMVYLCNVLWVSYAMDQGLWGHAACTIIGAVAQLLSALFSIPIAIWNKANHAYGLMRRSMLLLIIAAPLLFWGTKAMVLPAVLLGLVSYVLGNALICSSMYYLLYLQLPVSLRCRGVSTFWAIAASLGASALPLSEHLLTKGLWYVPALIVSGIAMVSFMICKERSPANYDAKLAALSLS